MNKLVFILILLPVVCFSQMGYFGNNRLLCPICQDSGMVSRVYPGGTTMTLMNCGNGYYDTLGVYHSPPDCNQSTTHYSCSKGHEFTDMDIK